LEPLIIITWIILVFAGGFIAEEKGHSVGSAIGLCLFFGPIGFIIVLARPVNVDGVENNLIKSYKRKKCMHCSEVVKWEAKICKWCGNSLPATDKIKTNPEKRPDEIMEEIKASKKFKE